MNKQINKPEHPPLDLIRLLYLLLGFLLLLSSFPIRFLLLPSDGPHLKRWKTAKHENTRRLTTFRNIPSPLVVLELLVVHRTCN